MSAGGYFTQRLMIVYSDKHREAGSLTPLRKDSYHAHPTREPSARRSHGVKRLDHRRYQRLQH